MKKSSKAKMLFVLLAVVVLATALSYTARADRDDVVTFRARLTGFQEVPAKLTTGRGTFRGKLDLTTQTITFTENWTNLVGNTVTGGQVLFSHIHFGQPGVSGGVTVFLCGPTGATNPHQPACQQASTGSATGSFNASDVFPTGTGSSDQGIAAGDFTGLLRIIRSGNAYANIHTTQFPSGEIRGQISVSRDDDDDDR